MARSSGWFGAPLLLLRCLTKCCQRRVAKVERGQRNSPVALLPLPVSCQVEAEQTRSTHMLYRRTGINKIGIYWEMYTNPSF